MAEAPTAAVTAALAVIAALVLAGPEILAGPPLLLWLTGDLMTQTVQDARGSFARRLWRAGLLVLLAWVWAAGVAHSSSWQELVAAGDAAKQAGRIQDAERFYTQAIVEADRWRASRKPLASSVSALGLLLHERGRYHEAEKQFLLAREALESSSETASEEYGLVLSNLADSQRALGRAGPAQRSANRSVEVLQAIHGQDHVHVAGALNVLAGTYAAKGEYERARTIFLDVLEIRRRVLPPSDPGIAVALVNLGLVERLLGESASARERYVAAVALLDTASRAKSLMLAEAVSGLAGIERSAGRYQEALQLDRQALDIRRKMLSERHELVAVTMSNLGNTYYLMGRVSDAESLFR